MATLGFNRMEESHRIEERFLLEAASGGNLIQAPTHQG